MASAVDISNLALAHLGDEASVASIDPPEGGAQAEHCARWYPIARDEMLELHDWNFATTRAALPLLAAGVPQWAYAYARPAGAVRILSVIDKDAPDDLQAPAGLSGYAPQPFILEAMPDGTLAILTNQANAAARYTLPVTDTTRFSPLFVGALSYLLASKLAGPVIKGAEGRKATLDLRTYFDRVALPQAKVSDANQRHAVQPQQFPWGR
jgi:hypothetical protein